MDDNFAEFEEQLRGLRPAGVSKRLDERIALTLAAEPSSNTVSWWRRLGFSRLSAAVGWVLLPPAAAVVAVVVTPQVAGIQRPPTHPVVVPSGSHPTAESLPATGAVHASNVLYQTQDDGVVLDAAQRAVHRVRYRSADLVRWRNPATGAVCEVSYPREDVMLTPIHVD